MVFRRLLSCGKICPKRGYIKGGVFMVRTFAKLVEIAVKKVNELDKQTLKKLEQMEKQQKKEVK